VWRGRGAACPGHNVSRRRPASPDHNERCTEISNQHCPASCDKALPAKFASGQLVIAAYDRWDHWNGTQGLILGLTGGSRAGTGIIHSSTVRSVLASAPSSVHHPEPTTSPAKHLDTGFIDRSPRRSSRWGNRCFLLDSTCTERGTLEGEMLACRRTPITKALIVLQTTR